MLTYKSEAIYSATLLRIKELAPQMNPSSAMGNWEPASRNAIKTVYPNIGLYGCWFPHNQAIWIKVAKLGLLFTLFHANTSFKKFIKSIKIFPLLPSEHIVPMFDFVNSTFVSFTHTENFRIEKFKQYYKRQWLTIIVPSQLSIFTSKVTTNNGAESYYAKISNTFKSKIQIFGTFVKLLTLSSILT